ncbi:MAG: DNA polymerase III subunit gamma/tau [Parcubacteria group bacterium Gr01-1014_66]|nr:MAG: DNA polymerase III subunit gamma/tau [Parcubacteria group bacterium Gr01-1014_66]
MSSPVLYRKYRPIHFDEVVGQEHVVVPLKNALKKNRIAHAYLFSGPRGVGKTTLARIIAKSLNCQTADSEKPCGACAACIEFQQGRTLSVIEIDAASNRGIDEIRELREGVRFLPSQGHYKTYIIDEVHMLTREAFNALLKTLEEPPSHAVFVLATTEIEKVPATIVSRTQHYSFRRPRVSEIASRIQMIAQKEGAILEEDGALIIAHAAEGSIRDGESILGQIMAVQDAHITREEVEQILGLPPREAIKKLFAEITQKNHIQVFTLIQDITESGLDLAYVTKILLSYFRSALFLKTDPSLDSLVASHVLPDELEHIKSHLPSFTKEQLASAVARILENMQRFRRTPLPQLPLEVTVMELMTIT